MLKKEMETLREKINKMIVSDDTGGEELLKVSMEMDILIVEGLKKSMKILRNENKIE